MVFYGQVPGKSRYRHRRTRAAREQWARIKGFEEKIGRLAAAAQLTGKRLAVTARVSVKCYRQRVDPDNALKAILDGLEGVVFVNDRHVHSEAEPVIGATGPARVEIHVHRGRMESVGEERNRVAQHYKKRRSGRGAGRRGRATGTRRTPR